jgi:NAD(P)-dependent dehydrogenase (short-subunit alcohol dehydrogenase family)
VAEPLAGRVAIVSGGGKGLGRSFCLALARQGAKVVVNNHNRAAGAAGRVVAEITAAGGEAVADYGDAADPGSGEAMVAAALERWGRLDICVPNAAVGTPGMFHKQPAAEFAEVVDVNLLGSARLADRAGQPGQPAQRGIRRHRRRPAATGVGGGVGDGHYSERAGSTPRSPASPAGRELVREAA